MDSITAQTVLVEYSGSKFAHRVLHLRVFPICIYLIHLNTDIPFLVSKDKLSGLRYAQKSFLRSNEDIAYPMYEHMPEIDSKARVMGSLDSVRQNMMACDFFYNSLLWGPRVGDCNTICAHLTFV